LSKLEAESKNKQIQYKRKQYQHEETQTGSYLQERIVAFSGPDTGGLRMKSLMNKSFYSA
jgi:hypothetical protein